MAINLFSWLVPGTKDREISDTRASWERAERAWKASPLASFDPADLADEVVREAMQDAECSPAVPVLSALCEATEELARAESIGDIEPLWGVIEENVEAAVGFREMVARRSAWATNFKAMRGVWATLLSGPYREFVKALPESCFGERDEKGEFEVPLIDLLDNPAELIEKLISFPFSDEALNLKLFEEYRGRLRSRIAEASGMSFADMAKGERSIVPPTQQKNKSARELLDLYLGGTPFADLFALPVPFSVPEQAHHAFRGEVSRIILEALRKTTVPLSTTDLTERVMRERGLDLNDAPLRRTMGRRIGACLNHWRRVRGVLKSMPGPGQVNLWELTN